jgi:hypothetical protein
MTEIRPGLTLVNGGRGEPILCPTSLEPANSALTVNIQPVIGVIAFKPSPQ